MKIDRAVSKVSDYLRENHDKPEFRTITQIRRGCCMTAHRTRSVIKILLASRTIKTEKRGNKTIIVLIDR